MIPIVLLVALAGRAEGPAARAAARFVHEPVTSIPAPVRPLPGHCPAGSTWYVPRQACVSPAICPPGYGFEAYVGCFPLGGQR